MPEEWGGQNENDYSDLPILMSPCKAMVRSYGMSVAFYPVLVWLVEDCHVKAEGCEAGSKRLFGFVDT